MLGSLYPSECQSAQLPIRLPDIFKLAPGDDLVMSTMYSLLNYIAASSKSSEGSKMIGSSPYMNDGDPATNSYVETGLRSFTDEEKRLVSISTICVVSTLALEFKIEEVVSDS